MASTRRASRKSASRKNRKSSRKSRGMSDWNKRVMATYRQMKARNPNATLGDAMKAAARKN
jgi:hypothetical protein